MSAIVDSGSDTNELLRRVQFGIRILNEHQLTDAIDESMLATTRETLGKGTKYLPLLGSFDNLRRAACAVEPPDRNPEDVEDFLYATAAFGLEVVLWSIGAPYKMAWCGTRFVSNRTFFRFARHGCDSCIAFG
jgi:hypothetical protein